MALHNYCITQNKNLQIDEVFNIHQALSYSHLAIILYLIACSYIELKITGVN